jgi:putative heme-binding domain-containing protein
MLRCSAEDRTYLEACGLAAEGIEDRVWTALRTYANSLDPLHWTTPFAMVTWRLGPVTAIDSLQKRAESPALPESARLFAVETLAFIDDPLAAKALVAIAKAKGPVGAEAARWLIHLGATRWNTFGIGELLKTEGIYDPDKVEITEVVVPDIGGKSTLPSVAEILALNGDAERGKLAAARCIMCHRIDDQGVNFGPSLQGWIANQGEEMFVKSVVTPSGQIALGYSGSTVRLKDGSRIDGLVLSPKDPVIVQSQGGLVQIIPVAKVATVEPLEKSLMPSADQLGMTAQEIADLCAYLKEGR